MQVAAAALKLLWRIGIEAMTALVIIIWLGVCTTLIRIWFF